jgi:hypothetical protein
VFAGLVPFDRRGRREQQLALVVPRQEEAHPEVEQADAVALADHDVGWLHVAVDDAGVVGDGEDLREVDRQREGAHRLDPVLGLEPETLHDLHREVGLRLAADLVHPRNTRVIDGGERTSLAAKPRLQALAARVLGEHRLERDPAAKLGVECGANQAHAALAELVAQDVAVREPRRARCRRGVADRGGGRLARGNISAK